MDVILSDAKESALFAVRPFALLRRLERATIQAGKGGITVRTQTGS
jgi:hypothetical protein